MSFNNLAYKAFITQLRDVDLTKANIKESETMTLSDFGKILVL